MQQTFDVFGYAHGHFSEVAWMGQNTNHLFPKPVVRKAVQAAMKEARYEEYPFASGLAELKSAMLEDFALPQAKVGITSGGTEALYMLTRALLSPGDEVISSDPTYLIIHKFIELSGATTVNHEIYAAPWRLTADRINNSITPKTRMILLIDPLNPLGSGYPESEVKAIAEIAHDKKLLLLNDVTYRDFADKHTLAATYAPEETVTVWSLSKNCGLAGLRIGGLFAAPDLFSKIWKYNTNDLGVNVLSQWAALAAMKVKKDVFPRIKSRTRANQRRIKKVVESVPGCSLPVYPSQGNMFVIDISQTGIDPQKLQQELLENHNVFLRGGNYLSPKFGNRFIRISFSNSTSDVERFSTAFPAAVQKLRGAPA
jgi:aspartate/methionine/tyrosine aminotransferase